MVLDNERNMHKNHIQEIFNPLLEQDSARGPFSGLIVYKIHEQSRKSESALAALKVECRHELTGELHMSEVTVIRLILAHPLQDTSQSYLDTLLTTQWLVY